MGFGQRFKEKLRQGTHLSKDGTHFKGTDNERNKMMMKEADECAARLRSFKKKLITQHEATESLLRSIEKTLGGGGPKAYDRDSSTNAAVPSAMYSDPVESLRVSELANISSRHEAQLRGEVYAPIDKWLAVHKEFTGKMSTLENHRLEFDNARRLHNRVELDKVRQMQKNDAVEPDLASKLDAHINEADGRRMTYTQYEAEIHAQLTALLEDASNMQTVFAHALRIEADLLASSVAHNARNITEEQLTGAPRTIHAIQTGAQSQPISGVGQSNPSGAGPAGAWAD
ncbi:hypothetical protein WJX84_003253 [Apatococcus fuscideae]|uniref:BAR domain-containing protein n=1 Tax=Apatococcus fuscideae TaxID=2026836 RepID=A0AAW1SSY1_9CHLO